MSKKLLTIIGILALGAGTIGSIALQSHAQIASLNPANQTSVSPVVNSTQQENNTKDADNIQSGAQDNNETDTNIGQETEKNKEVSGETDVNEPTETNSVDAIEN